MAISTAKLAEKINAQIPVNDAHFIIRDIFHPIIDKL